MKKKHNQNRKIDAGKVVFAVLLLIVLYPMAWVGVWLWNLGDMIINGADYYGDTASCLYALALAVIVDVALFISDHLKSDKQKQIEMEFYRDKTSICLHCGSKDIHVYPKGYNYKFAFWGTVAGSKNAPFLAGIESNRACCRCRNCGKKWETPYDYDQLG